MLDGFGIRKAVVGALLAPVLVAGAAADAVGAETRFSGSCVVYGVTTFDPPVRMVAQAVSYRVESLIGTCTGSLGDVPVTEAPVVLVAAGTGTIGCSTSSADGAGTLRFTRGTATPVDDAALPLGVTFGGALTEWWATWRGVHGGEAQSRLSYTIGASRYHPEQCAASDPRLGVREVEFELTASTLSPLVGPSGPAEALRLDVRSPASQRLRTLRRHGLRVRMRSNAPVDGTLAVRLRARTLVERAVSIGGAMGGRSAVTLRLPARALRQIRTARASRLSVAVRMAHFSGAAAERVVHVRVKR